MKTLIRIISYILILGMVPLNAYAGRSISLPFTENFDSDAYARDLIWTSGGASHTHLPNGGWSGGAARFTPPTDENGQDYSGLGAFTGLSEKVLHVRILMKVGRTYHTTAESTGYGDQNKFIIVDRTNGGNRGMTIFESQGNPANYYTFGACEDNTCIYEGGSYWPDGNDSFKHTDYMDEWICMELEMDLNRRETTVHLWTQDGRFNGSYVTRDYSSDAGFWNQVQIIGGYYNGRHSTDPDTYIMFDELKIDREFIGPPSGFMDGASGDGGSDETDPVTEPETDSGLNWTSDFEQNNFNDWTYVRGDLVTTTESPRTGQYCARATLTQGTLSDNYADFYFGDHSSVGGDKVEEVYLKLSSKFSSQYDTWPSNSHKIALLNLTDGESNDRRYQVMVNVDRDGRYFVEHSYIDTWQFFGLSQNTGGDPAGVRYGQWDDLKLYVRLNTPGASDGIIRLYVNEELKVDYTNVNIRQNTSYGLNKLILSSYATDQSMASGYQYYDDWSISSIEPNDWVSPLPAPQLSISDN